MTDHRDMQRALMAMARCDTQTSAPGGHATAPTECPKESERAPGGEGTAQGGYPKAITGARLREIFNRLEPIDTLEMDEEALSGWWKHYAGAVRNLINGDVRAPTERTPLTPVVLEQWEFVLQVLNSPRMYGDRISELVEWVRPLIERASRSEVEQT